MTGPARITGPGLLLGVGFGAFVDGIVLHQLLQWHHMLSSVARYPMTTVAGLRANTVADGLFHVFALVVTVTGLAWLWWRGTTGGQRWERRELTGLVLAGWGLFDLVEGLVDHELLGVHHVREDVPDPLPWDLGFLVLGALLVLAGVAVVRGARRAARDPARR